MVAPLYAPGLATRYIHADTPSPAPSQILDTPQFKAILAAGNSISGAREGQSYRLNQAPRPIEANMNAAPDNIGRGSGRGRSRAAYSRTRERGFTLVELLVVIGIIAVLIGILLPTLIGARRAAYTVQCSSNMKQLATAMLMYIQDNKGKFPAAAGDEVAGITPPGGWWWPDTLVQGNYIKGSNLNVYKKTPSTTDEKVFSGASPFRCPEGISEEFGKLSGSGQGDYPTSLSNNAYQLPNDSQHAAVGFGVPSWY